MADKKRGGLGRGLEYLFAESPLTEPASVLEPVKSPINDEANKINGEKRAATRASKGGEPAETVVYIGLNDIKPNASQPRKNFDPEALQELADSIKEHGMIQPVLLRPAVKGYELVAGERRWRAARLAGLKSIPAIVRELTERQNAFYALIENMQREDLDPIEEGDGIIEIINNYGLTQEEAAKVIGKSRSYVTNALRIAKLPTDIRSMVSSRELSAGHARAIAGLATEALQLEAAVKAVKEGWSVRQIESYTGTKTRGRRKAGKGKTKSADVRAVEQALTEHLGAKVRINGTEKQGKLEIEYYSKDELDRLVELLGDL
ncbi:MAG: ParB/RepB/Spo0J family partition protein [Firmicutes bacterium]|nr:ParB/RepB/Spo0J family partition protein [Bacillota bacterium]